METESLAQALAAYLDHLAAQNRAANTLRTYEHVLEAVLRFLATRGIDPASASPQVLTPRLVSAHLAAEARRGLAPASRALTLRAISGFLRFCALTDRLDVNAEKLRAELAEFKVKNPVRKPAPPRTLGQTLAPWAIEATVRVAPGHDGRAQLIALRNSALLQALYCTGMRVAEVCALNRGAIDRDSASATIRGKGAKERQVYFTDSALAAIDRYLAARQDRFAPLFLGHSRAQDPVAQAEQQARGRGEALRLSPRQVERIVQRAATAADLEATPHTYRHNFATQLLHSGAADIRDVQELLGHASLATTQIYTHPNPDRLGRAVRGTMEPPHTETGTSS